MDADIRPDLTRILPRPVNRPTGGVNRFEDSLIAPENTDRPDYLLEVDNDYRPSGDELGFTVYQAQAAAERIAQVLGDNALRPGLFAFDRARTQRLLG